MEIVITGGEFKGRRLVVPDNPNVRPTMGIVREALFSSLGDRVSDSRFLDLYAGFGTVGIEALSRGARSVTFVEKDKMCVDVIKKNVRELELTNRVEVFNISVERFLQITDSSYDIIYLDPPYLSDCSSIVLEILNKGVLASSGIIIWETSIRSNIDKGRFNIVKERRYGETLILYIEGER